MINWSGLEIGQEGGPVWLGHLEPDRAQLVDDTELVGQYGVVSGIFVEGTMALIFLSIGIASLFWPERIRELTLYWHTKPEALQKFIPFSKFVRTPAYITSLKIIGIVCLSASFLCMYVAVKKIRG